MTLVPFARQSKAGDAAGYSGERLVNYFIRPGDGVSQGILIGRSGLASQYDLGGPVRTILDHSGVKYAAAAGGLWKLDGTGATKVCSIPDSADLIAVSNGAQIAVVAGGLYYLWDGDTIQQITIAVLTDARCLTYQDGYFIVGGVGSGRKDLFTISALDDGTTFNALEFASAESDADALTCMISDHGQVWAFGKSTIEVFYNSGALDFPFVPNQGAKVEKGCTIGTTVARADNALFFWGTDGAAYRLNGSAAQVISTREIEDLLKASTITGGFTFTERGHWFYALSREGETTVCFDVTTGMWAERSTGGIDAAWDVISASLVGGKQYFGTASGAVCLANDSRFDDNGAEFICEAISVPVDQRGELFTVNKVHLQMDTGVSGISRTPQVMLQTSQDGRTWSVEKWRDLTERGGYYRRATWHGMGVFRRFQVKVRVSDHVKRDILGVVYE